MNCCRKIGTTGGWLAVLVIVLVSVPVWAEEGKASGDDPMAWWKDARFGLFVHWGPVSQKGTEIGWSRGGVRRGTKGPEGPIPVDVYDNLYKTFNPTQFDAKAWVSLAKEAGMKYVVFTTKHHDGFCNFDSALTDYKITNSPFKRDIVAELAAACHEGGLRLGFYYSPPDWHHPDFMTENHKKYIEYFHGQVRELLTKYGKIDIMWFDGLSGTAADYDAEHLLPMVRSLQPGIIINNRAGLPADFDTPEQVVGTFQNTRPWETCMTICNQWAWKPDDRMKTLKECLRVLAGCAGGDGNLLFNVGPMPTGEIEPRQVARLKEMGAWLQAHGESIYGTHGGPFLPAPWGVSTYQGKKVYVHVFDWPEAGVLIPKLPSKIVGSRLLDSGEVSVKEEENGYRLTVAQKDQQDIDTVVVLELAEPIASIQPIGFPWDTVVSQGKPATASQRYANLADYGPEKAFDGDSATRWATNSGTAQAWLQVDLGQPTKVGRIRIQEACEKRVKRFRLERLVEKEWKTVFEGGAIGTAFEKAFEPVCGQVFRVNVLDASEGPTFWEVKLLPEAQR